MNLLGYVLPPWARWVALAALLFAGIAFGWVEGAGRARALDDARIARIEADHAQELTRIAQAGAAAAQRTAAITAEQSAITQESDHAAITQRAALDARIAAGGLRIRATFPAPATRGAVPAVPSAAGRPDADAGRPVPAEQERGADALPADVGPEVLAGAARDAQRQLQLMDWLESQRETNPGELHASPDAR